MLLFNHGPFCFSTLRNLISILPMNEICSCQFFFLMCMSPNTTDPFSVLILLDHWWSFVPSWKSLPWIPMSPHFSAFLPTFLSSPSINDQINSKLFCRDWLSLVPTHISNLTQPTSTKKLSLLSSPESFYTIL